MFNCILIVSLLITSPVLAQKPAASRPAGPKTLAMTIHPRSVPSPILKYMLLPRQANRRVGNAALFYFQSALNLTEFKGDDTLDRYADLPLDQLPRKEVEKFLNKMHVEEALANAELAAHCQSCDWQWAARPKHQLVPDIGGLEQFPRLARLIGLQARLRMAQGHYDRAARSLQVGFDLAHRLGQNGTVIHAVVAGSIESYMLQCVQEWIQQPDAPNLYWALEHLPRSFYDMRGIMEYDRAVLLSVIPALQPIDPRHAPAGMLWKIVYPNFLVGPCGGNGPIQMTIERIGVWFKYAGDYGKARAYLRSAGLSDRQIKQMGYARVMGVYINHLYQSWSDRWLACTDLPYWRARPRLDRLDTQWKRFIKSGPTGELLGNIGLDTQRRLWRALARTDRQIATFQTIEALRAYAAGHDGHLPANLDALSPPAPIDPFTGQPLAYQRTTGGFRLDVPQGSHKSFVPEVYNLTLGDAR